MGINLGLTCIHLKFLLDSSDEYVKTVMLFRLLVVSKLGEINACSTHKFNHGHNMFILLKIW